VIVVISGQLGPGEVAYYAKDIAAEGYYAVLVDGRDFWKKGYWSSGTGWALLRGVVARAQQSPHALTALSSEIRRPGAAMMRPTRSGGLWTIYNELPLEPPLNGRG